MLMGVGIPPSGIIQAAYAMSPVRTILLAGLPGGDYDYIANLPRGAARALQKAVEDQFGLTARRETREMDVFLLTLKTPNAPGLKPAGLSAASWGSHGEDDYIGHAESFSNFSAYLEDQLKVPVIDQTGLSGRFDITLKWGPPIGVAPNADRMKQPLLDQLGLELIPARRLVDLLIVERKP